MVVALGGKLVEDTRLGKVLTPLFVYVGGYGPLLCAISCGALVAELRKADLKWDKTIKSGKVRMQGK